MPLSEWPILVLDQGGLAVHKMQAMLSSLGFNCGEDDAEYWFMGTDTKNALQAFQASEMLPETGIVDFTTWKKLFKRVGMRTRRSRPSKKRSRWSRRTSIASIGRLDVKVRKVFG